MGTTVLARAGGNSTTNINIPGGKFVNNLIQKQFVSEYSQSIIAGTGTPTIVKNDTTETVTITIPATLSGRAFIAMDAISFLAGHTYCISFYIGNAVKNSFGGNFLDVVAAPTVDFGEFRIAMNTITANKTFAAIFQPTTTQSVTFRLGFGISGNQTAGATDSVIEISKIMVEDLSITGTSIPSEYIGARQSAIIRSKYLGALAGNTSGALTVTYTAKSELIGTNIAIFGDSYVNDVTDYPEQLKLLSYPRIGVWYQPWISTGVTVAGTRPSVFLGQFTTKMQALINQGLSPKYVLLQSSLNTILNTTLATQDANIATDVQAIRVAAEWALRNSITPILTNMAAWKTGASTAWLTDSVYLAQQKWDTEIYALAAEFNIPVFNLRGCVEDATTPYLIASAYDNGDGTHPNATGMALIAAKLQTFLTNL